MRVSRLWICILSASLSVAFGATIPGDAARGRSIFEEQRCVHCHSVNGEGGEIGPDLAARPLGQYTPSLLAAAIWNHAPEMWTAIEAAGIEAPQLSVQEAADVFAYFYAFRYFEQPGDAARGKQVFETKGCVGCHGVGATGSDAAPEITEWESAGDTIQLARAMWNHAPRMREEMGTAMAWPRLTAQEMTDLFVYVQNLPSTPRSERTFSPASADAGEELYESKGCASCHASVGAFSERTRNRTMADLAAAMWNHAPQARQQAGELGPQEMSSLVGYLWSIQYFDEPGDPRRGAEVAAQKNCTSCHGAAGSAAPAFASLAGDLDSITFVSRVWEHGPTMWEQVKSSGREWPRFANNELNDLLAYINSL